MGIITNMGQQDVKQSKGNVYKDIGILNADEMLLKAQLVAKINEIIKDRHWTQQEAAKILGMTQPKLSMMLRGQFRGISEVKMLECLARLGHNIKIIVGPDQQSTGKVQVMFAG